MFCPLDLSHTEPDNSQTEKEDEQCSVTVTKTTEIQSPSSNNIGTKCSICFKEFRDRSDLLAHYSCQHFKTELLELIGYVDENYSCPLCKTNLKDKTSLTRHFGVVHKMVQKFINVQMEKGQSNVAHKSTQENEKQNQSLIMERNQSQCKICFSQFKQHKILIEHYCLSHFKDKLTEMIRNDGAEQLSKCICPICNLKISSEKSLIVHYGRTHQKVTNLIQIDQNENKTEYNPIEERTFKNDSNSWSCHFCVNPPFKDKKSLHYHVAGVHFKDQIKAIVGDTNVCPECGKTVLKCTDLIRHVGVVHRYLDRFLPDFLLDIPQKYDESLPNPAQSTSPKLIISMKNKRKIIDSDKESEEECDNDWNPSGSTRKKIKVDQENKYLSYNKFAKKESTISSPSPGSMTCHICFLKTGRTFSSRAKLYEHYSVVHYKEELEFKFGTKFSKFCPECGHPKENLIGHLGATHNMVEQFLPKPYHIPMSKQPVINSRSPTPTPHPECSGATPVAQASIDSEDDQLVRELDAKLSAVWNVTDAETNQAASIDHCYLDKLQESDSPEDTTPRTTTSETQILLTEKENSFITLSEDVEMKEQEVTSLLE